MDIREYWGPKKENIIISVEKIYSFLKQLEPIDDVFKLWFLLGKSQKDALSKPFDIAKGNIEYQLKKRLKKHEVDTDGFSIIGYRIALYHFSERGEMAFSICIGTDSKYFKNNCLMDGTVSIGEENEQKIRELIQEVLVMGNISNVVLNKKT